MADLDDCPVDWKNPKWHVDHLIHNWRNYATPELREIWWTLSDYQRQVIATCLEGMADREEWD